MPPYPMTLALHCPKCKTLGAITLTSTGHATVPELYVIAKSGSFNGAVTSLGTPLATCLTCRVSADVTGVLENDHPLAPARQPPRHKTLFCG
jgi:hypothetical protein